MRLAFCSRSAEAARLDLRRICAEIREETEPETLPLAAAQALKSAAAGRPGAAAAARHRRRDLRQLRRPRRPALRRAVGRTAIVRHALGDVPLAGFFAAGEIARHHLYGYTGVLTVFRTP